MGDRNTPSWSNAWLLAFPFIGNRVWASVDNLDFGIDRSREAKETKKRGGSSLVLSPFFICLAPVKLNSYIFYGCLSL